METAAVLAGYDIDVTWVFPDKQPMAGFFTAQMADFFMRKYEARGVTLMPLTRVEAFRREAGRLVVVLDSGMALPADMVVAGIGVEPATDLFTESSVQLDEGIVVNEYLETNLSDLYAAGDVANYRDILFDKQRHIEHWDNAKAQGEHVAKVMTGKREAFDHLP
jgi:NADPH-dependent 2,4-dienoyl-CoA reductase/sulfur reductase-like enzyme